MSHEELIRDLLDLPWHDLTTEQLEKLMYLSLCTAQEFAQSLRRSLIKKWRHQGLKQVASEELQTKNLQYGSYQQRGDHGEFLNHHFYRGGSGLNLDLELDYAVEAYDHKVGELSDDVLVMSIASREKVLPQLFKKVLRAPGWNDSLRLKAYRFYLERHVELDSDEGGHADQLNNIAIDHRVAYFWILRLKLYEVLGPEFWVLD